MAAVHAPQPRIAQGNVAATGVRLPRTEQALAGGAGRDEVWGVLANEIHPAGDVRSTADCRLRVAGNLLRPWEVGTG